MTMTQRRWRLRVISKTIGNIRLGSRLTDRPFSDSPGASRRHSDFSHPDERGGKVFVFPHLFAEVMAAYMATHGVTARELASIAVAEYANARFNPFAQMRDVDLAKGHPIGATGIAMIGWSAWQLAGKAPRELQVPSPRYAATFNIGGPICASVCTVLAPPA